MCCQCGSGMPGEYQRANGLERQDISTVMQEDEAGPASGNFGSPDALIWMHPFEQREKPATSAEERAAKAEKRRLEAEQAIRERKAADDAFRANFERLKAERLAREATNS